MKKVLVIDDDLADRTWLRQLLEAAGLQVDEAPEGRTGLELYRRRAHDLVITDIVMPDTEGIETILKLRQEFPTVKIIAVSVGGYLGEPDNYLRMATILGANEALAKPLSATTLLRAAVKLLDHAPCAPSNTVAG
jgi:YesN/AraC family two-component response regulator